MNAYLLDTNAVSDWLDSTKPRHASVLRHVKLLADTDAILLTSTVVLGEIQYGLRVAPAERRQSLEEFRAQINAQFVHRRLLLDVSRTTAVQYGDLRARLFEKYAPRKRRRKGLRAEELVSPTTGKELGIQENDLWIAAQAVERNLILVANDKMRPIQEAIPELRAEDWG